MILLLLAALQAQPTPDTLRVTFLGTSGGPNPAVDYAGPSALVEYGREVIMIDARR